ncbi:transglycosylase SLT domain-containing protein [Deefgea salmonis]|uniref:Transglycosylase SLT domain-containing protein n=1 Tax=Deefgea salmonis TaxID=2875502 RepID=A0ABS8BLU4_9NEIS|nr:transglycosylase SLT domain-containing protein [Deefgea salmonis]MCB5196674.1 transglycosylase SLT domain-containing protein [Deefgea salmonis]
MKRLVLCVILLCVAGIAWSSPPKPSKVKAEVASLKSTHPALKAKSALAQAGAFDVNNPPDRIRVLVGLGASTYFLKDGRPYGLEYALLSGFEAELNRTRAKGLPPIRIQFIPMDSGELIPALLAGEGDIAAGLIPITEGARSLISFSTPYAKDEWCLLGPKSSEITRFDALGETPVLLSSSSLGRRLLAGQGELSALALEDPPLGQSVESLLAEINAGKTAYTIMSRAILKLWGERFKDVQVGSCLAERVELAWVTRPADSGLLAALNRYIATKKVSMDAAIRATQRFLPVDAKAARSEAISPLDKLGFFMPMFQTIAAANNLDWMLLAAIGQKETKLNPVVRKNGPTGVMQVNPSTARAMGVSDPHGNEGNITAAAKYLAYLRKVFSQQGISEDNQLYFMIAAYNAGEGRLAQIRSRTKAQGLDPNVWLGNVEKTAMNQVSKGMVDYVSTVNRYYLAYQSAEKTVAKKASHAVGKNTQ